MLRLLFTLISFATLAAGAQTQSYKIKVGEFDRLKVTDNATVVYRCVPDSSGYAVYKGRKEFADAFILSVKKGTLQVQVSTEDVGDPDLPVLYVYSDFLTEVESSSDFSVTVENPAPCPELKAVLVGNGILRVENIKATRVNAGLATGNGTLVLDGTCQEATLRMLGVGTVEADRLKAGNVNCKILGSGTIGCWPSAKLNVKGIGSTKIYYKGNPTVKKSGGGKLFRLREGPGAVTDTVPEE